MRSRHMVSGKGLMATFFGLLLVFAAHAQKSGSSFDMMKFSASSHIVALGGENISLIEDNPYAGWNNPSLYSGVSDNSAGLSFMTYAAEGKYLGAQYVKAFGERHTAALHAQYLGFGSMDETDASGNVIGTFSAKDIIIGGAYSYLFSERWAGGVAGHMVYSKYADFSAIALAVDLGVNYYNEDKDFSLSMTLRNFGHQVKTFDDQTQRVPYDLQLGFTKGMAHAPIRFSLTMVDLTRWKSSHYFSEDGEKLKFSQLLLNHFVAGVDFTIKEQFYIAAGYNARRAYELKAAGKGRGAGLSIGAGLDVKKIKAGVSYARYHSAFGSLMFNVGYSF